MSEVTTEDLQHAGDALKASLPRGTGFIVFTFPLGPHSGAARLRYLSNGKREDCLNLLKEWMLKCGAAEDWMKHIR